LGGNQFCYQHELVSLVALRKLSTPQLSAGPLGSKQGEIMSEKICFVISPIGEPESDTRKRADSVLNYIITPIVKSKGYDPLRADKISDPDIITSQVIQYIIDSPLVIADLSEKNANVFYELAIRHAIKKPLIQIIRKGESIPFDVQGMRTIFVDHQDLGSAEEAKVEIGKQIDAIEKNASIIQTPISMAIDLQSLRQSTNPEQRSLADIQTSLSALRSSTNKIENILGYIQFSVNSRSTPVASGSIGTEALPSGTLASLLGLSKEDAYLKARIELLSKSPDESKKGDE
jgi:hypothetical protein